MKAKITIIGLALAFFLASGAIASAQGISSEMQDFISGLRAQHADLKAQVEAGDMTKEEARALWATAKEEAQVVKEAHFTARLAKTQERIAQVALKNPERALELQERSDAMVERRTERHAKLDVIRTRVQSGEITREEARETVSGIRAEQTLNREEYQQKREERRAQRSGNREAPTE